MTLRASSTLHFVFANLALVTVPLFAVPGIELETKIGQLADGFDYPVGKPDAFGYFKGRGFRSWHHLGEDWNGLGEPDSDLGNPVFSIAHGIVVYSDDYRSSWGNVVIVRHAYRHSDGRIYYIDSVYAHLNERTVELYERVKRGQSIGTIGSNRGMYPTHLHFEIRKNINIGLIHSRYARDLSNYYSPSAFIEKNRSLRKEYRDHPIPVDTFDAGISNRHSGPRLKKLPEFPEPNSDPEDQNVDQSLRDILLRNNLIDNEPNESPETIEQRDKVRAFWSDFRPHLRDETK